MTDASQITYSPATPTAASAPSEVDEAIDNARSRLVTLEASTAFALLANTFWSRKASGATIAREIITVAKTANESTNTDTVLSNDSTLLATIAAKTYLLVMLIIFDDASVGVADLQYDFNSTGGGSIQCAELCFADGSLGTRTNTITTAYNTAKTINVLSSNTHAMYFLGLVTGAAGTFSWRWAQAVSSGSNLTVQAGSWLMLLEV